MQMRIIDYNYLWASGTTVTAAAEDPSFPVSNLDLPSRARVYRTPDGVKTATLVVDLGTPDVVDTAAVLFDPSRDMPLSTDATITIQGNDNATWDAPDYSEVVTITHDAHGAFSFLADEHEYRYWRIIVNEPSEARDFVELGKVVLARSTQLSTLPSSGFDYGARDRSKVDETPYGHKYVDLYPLQKRMTLEWPAIPYSDVRLLERVYRRAGRALPVLIALDPEGELFDPTHFVVYGTLASEIAFKQVGIAGFSHALSIEEVI